MTSGPSRLRLASASVLGGRRARESRTDPSLASSLWRSTSARWGLLGLALESVALVILLVTGNPRVGLVLGPLGVVSGLVCGLLARKDEPGRRHLAMMLGLLAVLLGLVGAFVVARYYTSLSDPNLDLKNNAP